MHKSIVLHKSIAKYCLYSVNACIRVDKGCAYSIQQTIYVLIYIIVYAVYAVHTNIQYTVSQYKTGKPVTSQKWILGKREKIEEKEENVHRFRQSKQPNR